jgi:DNA helicase IV
VDNLSIDDVALLDELDELIGRPPKVRRRTATGYRVLGVRTQATTRNADDRHDYRDYAHVIVDEFQDVTPMQWRMIGRRGQLASWTIVGDPAQTAWTGDPGEPARAQQAATGSRNRHQFALTTNYRNPAEIFEVAASEIRRIAPDLPLPQAVRSTGVTPVHLRVAPAVVRKTVTEATMQLLDEVDGTVGVITADAATRDEVAAWLPRSDRLQVVTGLAAKGMEYDGVLILSPDRLREQSGVRTLYVALSRATQRLTTVETAG